jgi:hypothetical protein
MSRFPVANELREKNSENCRLESSKTPWDRIVAAITNPDLIAVAFVCAIACLIGLNLILRTPDAALTIEQYGPFP